MRIPPRPYLFAGGAILVMALLLLPKIIGRGGGSGEPAAGRTGSAGPTTVRYVIVKEIRIPESVSTVGTILSNEEVEIRSEISGKVDSIPFAEGSRVRRGDLLVKINDEELQARLLSANARLQLARLEEQRLSSLLQKNLISQQEFDRGENASMIAAAEAQLIGAQLRKTSLFAPFDGTVSLRSISPGSYVSPNTLVATLVDDSRVKIDFALPEKYARRIARGDRLTFTVQETPREFSATVYAITPKIDPATRTIRMRGLAPNRERKLVPGGSANVEFRFHERTGLSIPAFAVIPELKRYSVFRLRNGRAESTIVELGLRMEHEVEVAAGLVAGDTVITSAILQLRPGAPVTPIGSGAPDGEGRNAAGDRE